MNIFKDHYIQRGNTKNTGEIVLLKESFIFYPRNSIDSVIKLHDLWRNEIPSSLLPI